MIALFTDFGGQDFYVGQLHAVLAQQAPASAIIDLFHHVPAYDIRAGAYLLPGLVPAFPQGTVFLCVVDPGVGGTRRPVFLRVDGNWFVGPDNGLFRMLTQRAIHVETYEINWRPPTLSASFHGRDLFAPVAAMLSCGDRPDSTLIEAQLTEDPLWPDDLAEVIYVDHFGNAITGYRASSMAHEATITINGTLVSPASTFSDVNKGTVFWYENGNGLVEIAVNQDRAADQLAITQGMPFTVSS